MLSQKRKLKKDIVKAIGKDSCSEKCKICQKCFRGKYELKEHISIQHKGERWRCEEYGCRKEFKSINGYRYSCSECNKNFTSNEESMNNKRSLHGAIKLSCEKCSSTFAFKTNLIRHHKTCCGRDSKENVGCFICGKLFKKTKYLLEHINISHPNTNVLHVD